LIAKKSEAPENYLWRTGRIFQPNSQSGGEFNQVSVQGSTFETVAKEFGNSRNGGAPPVLIRRPPLAPVGKTTMPFQLLVGGQNNGFVAFLLLLLTDRRAGRSDSSLGNTI
jgi:hypothetical protein